MSHFHVIIAVTLSSALLAAGCGGGYTTQESNAICKKEQERTGVTDEEVFKQCVVCFESCTTCVPQGTTPVSYVCSPEE
jgi:hypothetical protein